MVVEVYWTMTKPMELHYQFEVKFDLSFYQTFFRKKLTDIKGISDQKADKIQSEEIVNDLQVQKVKNEFEWNLVINVGVAALLLIY